MKRPNLFTKFLGRLRMNFAIGRLFRSPSDRWETHFKLLLVLARRGAAPVQKSELLAIICLENAIDLRPRPPARTGFSGLWPEIGKNRKYTGFGLPQKIGKNWPQKIGKLLKNWVGGAFSLFSAGFFLFSGGGQNQHISYLSRL